MTVFISTNPTTGRELFRTDALTPDALEFAVAQAHTEFLRWRATSLADRAALLENLAAQLDREQRDLAVLMTREMGKPFREALAELAKCAQTARFFAEQGPAWLADEVVTTDAARTVVRRRPLGPVLAVMPWNFPFWQLIRFGVPALLAGNTILMKHAPATMGSAQALAALFRRAGAPLGLVQHLPVDVDTVPTLLADPRVAAVTVTGSVRAGRAVAALAGQHIKPCVLELGGSDAFIVMPSADLDSTVAQAVTARLQNNGQSCIAAKRFIVHDAIYPAFQERLLVALSSVRVGDPMDEAVRLGPLVSARARDALHDQVTRAVAAGATLLFGGRPLPGPGAFYPPTVLEVPVDTANPAITEELFGPVFALMRARDLDHALALAEATRYGLTASLWTRDPSDITRAEDTLTVGGLFVNAIPRSDSRVPFGGVKESGFGRELGREGLHAFTSAQTIWQR